MVTSFCPQEQGSPNVFHQKAINCYITTRGPNIICNVFFGIRNILANQQIFRIYTYCFDEMASRARFGPRAVTWRHLLKKARKITVEVNQHLRISIESGNCRTEMVTTPPGPSGAPEGWLLFFFRPLRMNQVASQKVSLARITAVCSNVIE